MGADCTADPAGKSGGGKRTVIMREVVNGLMYVLSTGCQWRTWRPRRGLGLRSSRRGYQSGKGTDFPPARCRAHGGRAADPPGNQWQFFWKLSCFRQKLVAVGRAGLPTVSHCDVDEAAKHAATRSTSRRSSSSVTLPLPVNSASTVRKYISRGLEPPTYGPRPLPAKPDSKSVQGTCR